MGGGGIEFDVGQDIIAVAEGYSRQGGSNKGYFYVLEKDNNGDWIQSTSLTVGALAFGVKIDPSDDSIYVSGEDLSGSDGFVAKFKKSSQGAWEQIWYDSDPDSNVINRLDITDNSQILVAGRTGSGGYSAAYDKDGNRTERLTDEYSTEAKASLDHSTSSYGTGFIREIDDHWIVGVGDGYSDNETPDLNQSYTSTGNPTVNIDYGSGSGEVTTPGNSGGGAGSGGINEPPDSNMEIISPGGPEYNPGYQDGYNWWEMDYET
jgi:hypothetical protein